MTSDKPTSALQEKKTITAGWNTTFEARGQGFDCTQHFHYETTLCDPKHLEIWFYSDRLSYFPGDEVALHVSTTAAHFSIEIIRDGQTASTFHRAADLTGISVPAPPEFYAKGCDWPVAHRWKIPQDAPSGFYLIRARGVGADGKTRDHEHGFFVRPARGQRNADILFLSSTATWLAYNDWGGANNYLSADEIFGHHVGSPRLTIHRPLGRGFAWQPEGAPRFAHQDRPPQGWSPRYPCAEYAYAKGYSKLYSAAGWASHERHMCRWAEQNGFRFDYATQHDLHAEPSLLDGYRCIVMVGHCEYWSQEMRDTIDRFVENGGNLARFAGNMLVKIRLEDDGNTMVSYKMYPEHDPMVAAGRISDVTGFWGVHGSPGTSTFGLDARWGIYGRHGPHTPRASGGYTVYRPEHWALAGTDLYYGDNFGDDARIIGLEADGLDYVIKGGLPYPNPQPGLPDDLQIIAMTLVSNHEPDRGHPATVMFQSGGGIYKAIALMRYGADAAAREEEAKYGSSMVVTFSKGKGQGFHAGTTEWVYGLKYRDADIERITRNVLERFTQP